MLKRSLTLGLILLALTSNSLSESKSLSDAQIKQHIIQKSIDSYPGNCPCPYNTAKNGSSCGRRSAYSRGGGYETICYPSDISPQMIKEYRKNISRY